MPRIIAAMVLVVSLFVTTPSVGAVNDLTESIVINEIHYNPSGENETDREFLELYNAGSDLVDLTGYAFTDGIEVELDGVIVPSGGYVIVAPDENSAESTYGVAPVATYSGKLSNKGETVTLTKGDELVDTVTYNDKGDWPTAADGSGPSLELAAGSDNSLAINWYASDPAPTPGAVNNPAVAASSGLTSLSVVPDDPGVDEPVTVSVSALGGKIPTLSYRIGFRTPVTAEMMPAGGTDRFSFTIPGQGAGELIRYRVELSAEESVPAQDDSITYLGVVVDDPEVTTGGAPVFQWFIAEADYQRMITNPGDREISVEGVFAYDGQVFDSTKVEVRGGNPGRFRDKLSLNFDLPQGYLVRIPEILPYPVDEFALAADAGDRGRGRAETSWWIIERAGFPAVNSAFVRLERNGAFEAVYRFQEKLDGEWRDANSLDSGGLYKANDGGFLHSEGFSSKSGTDRPPALAELARRLSLEASAEKTDFLFTWFDVSNLVNYMAVVSIIGHYDTAGHNYYVFQSDDSPNLWSLYPWDLDLTIGRDFEFCKGASDTDVRCVDNPLYQAVYEAPEIEAMVWARIATLSSEVLGSEEIEAQHSDRLASVGEVSAELDRAAWADSRSFERAEAELLGAVDRVREKFAAESRIPELGDPASVVISEIDYRPANDGPEVLILENTGSKPVDLSGWSIDAVFKKDKTIPGGTVILAGGQVVLTDSVAALRARYPELPNVVVVEFNGGLKSEGELVELRTPTGQIAYSVDYTDDAQSTTGPSAGMTQLGRIDETSSIEPSADDGEATDTDESAVTDAGPVSEVETEESAASNSVSSQWEIPVPVLVVALLGGLVLLVKVVSDMTSSQRRRRRRRRHAG